MLRNTIIACVVSLSSPASSQAITDDSTLSEEASDWDAVKNSNTSADIFAFIEKYPNGAHVKEAKALMIDVLWVEMAADNAVSETGDAPAVEENIVTFSAPLQVGSPDIVGASIEELINGSPLFPPVEGLPEAFWQAQDCTGCHSWQQENLCTQANTYLTDAGAVNLTKAHPYGGTFKENLQNWAQNGCQ